VGISFVADDQQHLARRSDDPHTSRRAPPSSRLEVSSRPFAVRIAGALLLDALGIEAGKIVTAGTPHANGRELTFKPADVARAGR